MNMQSPYPMDLEATPGPWTVASWSAKESAIVARVNGKDSLVTGYALKPDARLIAAAPDLYAALAELEAAILDGLCNSGLPDFDRERLERARIAARAALEKARGPK
jgi:hypothetical protein